MPQYEFHCPYCRKEVSMTLSLKERESGNVRCPDCRGQLVPAMSAFYSKTSRKS